ncbi:MAG: adenosine kinase [Prevotellaceae bacterium]|jgi:sugar/nucleoside kinase (ribokinase family)|nr:adenosine kinase [Prevotellaceae bacterium]
MKKIVGLGNAITDVLSFIVDDRLLCDLNVSKGSMQLIDKQMLGDLTDSLVDCERYMITGGSASNTISGMAKLGIRCGFIGKIGDDEVGVFFKNDSQENGVRTHLMQSDLLSGQCVVLVSPDGERTMCTYLGAACELTADNLSVHDFGGYDYFHIEGYLVQNHDLIRCAVQLAKQEGLKVSLDMASFNVVEENREFLLEIIRDFVDIVFANEEEAQALTGKSVRESLDEIAEICEIAVVKTGKNGSLIKTRGEVTAIEAIEANCVDTTGAGDLYASGFLYGLCHGLSVEKCGQIGSILAGNVVEVVGAKMDDERWEGIIDRVNYIMA